MANRDPMQIERITEMLSTGEVVKAPDEEELDDRGTGTDEPGSGGVAGDGESGRVPGDGDEPRGAGADQSGGEASAEASSESDGDGAQGEGEAEGAAGEGVDEPVTLEELAAELGVEPQQLYELQIPMGKDEFLTLGEFKDRARDLREIDQLSEQLIDDRAKHEREQMATRKEITELLAVLDPRMYSPEFVQLAQRTARETKNREEAALLEALPAWKDAETRISGMRAIQKLLSEYGYSEAEGDSIIDHRVKRILHDFVSLRERLNESKSRGKQVRERGAVRGRRRGGTSLRAAINRAKQAGASESDKLAGVSALLNEQR